MSDLERCTASLEGPSRLVSSLLSLFLMRWFDLTSRLKFDFESTAIRQPLDRHGDVAHQCPLTC